MEVIILGATIKILEFLAGQKNGLLMDSVAWLECLKCRPVVFLPFIFKGTKNSWKFIYILALRAKRVAKNGPFWRVFENLKLGVKQCYQTGQF